VNLVQAVISRLFTVALDRSLVDAHPAARMIKRFKERPSDRVLTDDELRTLWLALDAHPGAPADTIRLRLLLGQRGGEVIGMRWAEIDLKAAVWHRPGTRTKNGRPHSVPLPPSALSTATRPRSGTRSRRGMRSSPTSSRDANRAGLRSCRFDDRNRWRVRAVMRFLTRRAIRTRSRHVLPSVTSEAFVAARGRSWS
jgi:integrase